MTVVLVFTVVVVWTAPVVCVLVFFTKLTPDKRFALNDAWVRSLRATAYRTNQYEKQI